MTFDYGVVFFEEFVDGIVDPYSFTIGNHYAVELFVISMLIQREFDIRKGVKRSGSQE